MTALLFVCAGNICRSPMAAGVMRRLLDAAGLGGTVRVDSAGTKLEHAGAPPTDLARKVARRHGVDLGEPHARAVRADDFAAFDHMLVMDRKNLARLSKCRPDGAGVRLDLLLAFAPEIGRDEVPDPYGGAIADYEHAYQLIAAGAAGLLTDLKSRPR